MPITLILNWTNRDIICNLMVKCVTYLVVMNPLIRQIRIIRNYIRSLPIVTGKKRHIHQAFSQIYSASVSGGTAGMKYYISGNFKDINGIVENTGIKQR